MPAEADKDLGITTLTRQVTRDVWGDIEDVYFAVPSMYGIGETWSQFAAAAEAARIDGAAYVDVRVRSKIQRGAGYGVVVDQVVSRIQIEPFAEDATP